VALGDAADPVAAGNEHRSDSGFVRANLLSSVYRLRTASQGIREVTPPALTEVFALVTELGGVPVLATLLVTLYLFDDRETTSVVIGYALVALAVTVALKDGLGLPRPPVSARAVPVEPGSHGFPSGHAVASTVVYGGLALVRSQRRLAAVAAVLAALVGLSRVVIGVHYLGDVLVGHVVGLAVLVGLWRSVGPRADRACLVAAAAAAVAAVLTGASAASLLALGASVAGAVAFRERLSPVPTAA
jgi:membrane-associated phospholipid phosphatase